MPEIQRDEFEQRLLDDDVFSEQIHQAQQELLEDYADGALSSVHRKQLNPWIFCSSNRRQHVQLTVDLLYRGRRSKRIAIRLYVGVFAACVLLFVGLRLMHPLQYFRDTAQAPAEHSNLPTPNFGVSGEPSGLENGIARPDGTAAIRPMILRLVPERSHGESQPVATSAFAIKAAAPVLLQMLVPSGSGCEYDVLIHAETTAIPDRHLERVACVTVQGAQYVDVDLPPGTLPPGQYTVRMSGPEGVLMVRFIVHF
ncbi:MAG TPA: hypothetical protein VIX90_17585 [Edaphobacter sp.]